MTPTPVDPPVYPPITKLESERGVAKLSLSAVLLLACILSTALQVWQRIFVCWLEWNVHIVHYFSLLLTRIINVFDKYRYSLYFLDSSL